MKHDELVRQAVWTLTQQRLYDLIRTNFTPYQSDVFFDIIAYRRVTKEIRVIECKASRADFLADKKWRKYLKYCTRFAFMGPEDAFAGHEIPGDLGIIRPTPMWRYERGCRHLHDMQQEEYLAILEGFAGCYSRCIRRCWRERKG